MHLVFRGLYAVCPALSPPGCDVKVLRSVLPNHSLIALPPTTASATSFIVLVQQSYHDCAVVILCTRGHEFISCGGACRCESCVRVMVLLYHVQHVCT